MCRNTWLSRFLRSGLRSGALKPLPELPLLLQDLELESLDAVLERLLALAEGSGPQSRLRIAGASSPPTGCSPGALRRPLSLFAVMLALAL